jgi:hypothetical protein
MRILHSSQPLGCFFRTPTLPDVQAQIEMLLLKGRGPQKLNQPYEMQAALNLLLMAGIQSISQGAPFKRGCYLGQQS